MTNLNKTPLNYKEFSDEQLLAEGKKLKKEKIIRAVLIGFFVGVTIFGLFNKGIRLFTFVPLIFIFIIAKKSKTIRALEEELKSRNLTV